MIIIDLFRLIPIAFASMVIAGCTGGDPAAMKVDAFDAIDPERAFYFAGNEPFWGGSVTGPVLIYTTPEQPEGAQISVKRFAGNGGLGLRGELQGATFTMAVTPGECSDTMSDRIYPFTVTLMIGDDMREGCGWTAAQPFTDEEAQ